MQLCTRAFQISFEKLTAREEGGWFLSMQPGQTWWVHAKVISPSIHFCQQISLGNSPKCGNSLGTDWCRRVKKAETECVLKWVCMCVYALSANSNANKRKLLLSNSALVCSNGMSPVGSTNASSITWKFGHQIPYKTYPAHCEEYEFYDFHTEIIGVYLKVAALCKNFHFSRAWMLAMLHQYVCLIQRRSPYWENSTIL